MKNKNTIESLKKEGKIKLASELIFAKPESKYDKGKLSHLIEDEFRQTGILEVSWVNEIQEYCNTANILPSDLIEFHKASQKRNLKAKTTQETLLSDHVKSRVIQNKDKSNWRTDYIASKTGQK